MQPKYPSILLLYPVQEVKPRSWVCNWGHMDVPVLARAEMFRLHQHSHLAPGKSWAEVPELLRNPTNMTSGE